MHACIYISYIINACLYNFIKLERISKFVELFFLERMRFIINVSSTTKQYTKYVYTCISGHSVAHRISTACACARSLVVQLTRTCTSTQRARIRPFSISRFVLVFLLHTIYICSLLPAKSDAGLYICTLAIAPRQARSQPLAVARTSTSRECPFSPGLFGILFSCCALLPPLISLDSFYNVNAYVCITLPGVRIELLCNQSGLFV